MTSRSELTAWRIYLGLICGMWFAPLAGIALAVLGFPVVGTVMLALAGVCAALVVLLMVAGGVAMVVNLFRRPPPLPWLPYPYWYGWRWHRRWWPL